MNQSMFTRFGLMVVVSITGIGCSVAGPAADQINPFGAESDQTFGERNNSAILAASGSGAAGADSARKVAESMASYQRQHAPQPVYPVLKPAEVRLMWIPDHKTADGNLVPAHYYYLKVLNDELVGEDVFEIEGLLDSGSVGGDYGSGGGAASGVGFGSTTPWVYKEQK